MGVEGPKGLAKAGMQTKPLSEDPRIQAHLAAIAELTAKTTAPITVPGEVLPAAEQPGLDKVFTQGYAEGYAGC